MSDPSEVLMEAARILMRDGWTQHVFGTDNGPKCAMGAIRSACEVSVDATKANDRTYEAMDVLEQWLTDQGFEYCSLIPYWNDAPERTAEDVILALKRAATE